MGTALLAVYFATLLGCWATGMWGFLAIAKDAGISWTGPGSAIKIYEHAFTKMRGSRETRVMVGGFLGLALVGFGVPVVAARLGAG